MMHQPFSRQKIANEQDVVSLRKKVYQAFLICYDDNSFSVKIATMLSSLLKKIITDHQHIFLDTDVFVVGDYVKNARIRIFDPFYAISKDIPDLYLHQTSLSVKDDALELIIDRNFPLTRLEDALVTFNERSRDELLTELQSKNKDLQESYESLKRAKDNNARMESELAVGKNIQMSMLPTDFPSNEFIDLHAKLLPAREVGGDFYDFQIIEENCLYFVVGDVSGKGVPAALLMAMTKSLLRSVAITEHSTHLIITHVNNEIARENKNNMFVTIFLGLLNMKTGELTYTNAGHNPTYILSEDADPIKLSDRHGPVVGALEGFEYSESTIQLSSGQMVFAYTDGVTEAQNIHRELYSDLRLEKLIDSIKNKPIESLVNTVIEDVGLHEKESEQADDITVLCAKYTKRSNPDFSVSFPAVFEEKEQLTPQINSFFEDHKYPASFAQKVQIVLDELVSNIINYATKQEKSTDIQLYIYLLENKNGIKIQIIDNGIPFNPLEKEAPDITLSVEDRPIGGLGIHIVKSLASNIDYARTDSQNKITLLLKI
ncbi:ATP-binding SpoIIE family protein phosphatase [Flammeovirga aprica]|uniref:SpoIIE family protein phosphatase n=1 Tax=Flammeovirga aprica JL-4 TaxID=694437 RepID=A0A7X9XAI3_9BACT|nr:SpoIIE family protein phosphatase [Flammeovirga aprica]NME69644.1 SpoIIE family protein phosphatase [Flammeovirga aprica JL-4]